MQQGNYVSIWSVKKPDKGNYYEVRLSCDKKNKVTDKYETNFSSDFIRFVGNAAEAVSSYAGQVANGRPLVRGKIGSFDVTNCYVGQDGKVQYLKNPRYAVFDFESAGANNPSKTNVTEMPKRNSNSFMNIPDSLDSEDLPFN